MLGMLRRGLGVHVTVAQLLILALVIGTPYLLIGAIWSSTHAGHLHQMRGADLAVSFLGQIASWPVLLFSNVCMT
jgi:hypothetical protein